MPQEGCGGSRSVAPGRGGESMHPAGVTPGQSPVPWRVGWSCSPWRPVAAARAATAPDPRSRRPARRRRRCPVPPGPDPTGPRARRCPAPRARSAHRGAHPGADAGAHRGAHERDARAHAHRRPAPRPPTSRRPRAAPRLPTQETDRADRHPHGVGDRRRRGGVRRGRRGRGHPGVGLVGAGRVAARFRRGRPAGGAGPAYGVRGGRRWPSRRARSPGSPGILLPELRRSGSVEQVAGGWAVGRTRVTAAEDRLTVLGVDRARRPRSRAGPGAPGRRPPGGRGDGQLTGPGPHDEWALDLDAIIDDLEHALRPAPGTDVAGPPA